MALYDAKNAWQFVGIFLFFFFFLVLFFMFFSLALAVERTTSPLFGV